MGNPNNFTDGTLVGIVVGGDDNDPASDQSNNMKIFIPGLHGKDVKVEHLAFSTMMKMPSKASQSTFEGTLDPGSVVFVRKDTGSNQCHIVGTGNEIYDPESRTPGNFDLLSLPQIAAALNRTVNVRIPPTVRETTVNGVKVRQKVEKGDLHRHSLLQGIPANGAIYPMSGFPVPRVSGVASASQAFANILTPAIAAALPGISPSLGSILGSIAAGSPVGAFAAGVTAGVAAGNLVGGLVGGAVSDVAGAAAGQVAGQIVGATVSGVTAALTTKATLDLQKKLYSNLSPQMKMSFISMSRLVQSIETSNGGMFSSGAKADPTTVMINAVDMLSRCGNLNDMVHCMRRLQYDTSLYGQDKLGSLTLQISTPFGINLPVTVSASGAITQNIPAPLRMVIQAFGASMASASAFPGVNPGQNLFGDSAKVMYDMFGRLSGPAQQTAIQMSRALNQSGTAKTFNVAVQRTVQGGNPLKIMFL